MTISTAQMRAIIRQNGHLKLEGNETAEQLIMALKFLRKHTYEECHRPFLGVDISYLMPDINALEPAILAPARKAAYTKQRNAKNAGTKKGN